MPTTPLDQPPILAAPTRKIDPSDAAALYARGEAERLVDAYAATAEVVFDDEGQVQRVDLTDAILHERVVELVALGLSAEGGR